MTKQMMMKHATLLGLLYLFANVSAFAPSSFLKRHRSTSSSLNSEASTSTTNAIKTDPKEAVKIFGRLAEKYIMLDASAGMCCYSGCTGEILYTNHNADRSGKSISHSSSFS